MDIFYPFQAFADWLVFGLISLDQSSAAGLALDFFVYDALKILSLLLVIVMAVSFIRSFVPPEKLRDKLSMMPKIVAHLAAAALGIVTPFCSCSAVPLFLGFVEAGVPLGATFSFLVASPMINEVALVMLLGLFGWQIALLYILSGLAIAVLSGLVIGKMKVEGLLSDFVLKLRKAAPTAIEEKLAFRDRIAMAWDYTKGILRKAWIWVLVGVGAGAWIHGYVPTDFLAQVAGKGSWFAVPLATLIGIPLYSNAAGVLPLVGVLAAKGVSMGTALSFMMAVTALSVPEFLILKNVMRVKLIAIFASVVGTGIIITGYLFNAVLG